MNSLSIAAFYAVSQICFQKLAYISTFKNISGTVLPILCALNYVLFVCHKELETVHKCAVSLYSLYKNVLD